MKIILTLLFCAFMIFYAYGLVSLVRTGSIQARFYGQTVILDRRLSPILFWAFWLIFAAIFALIIYATAHSVLRTI